MSHTPPVPAANQSPFPLHPEPIDPKAPPKSPTSGTPVASARSDGVSNSTMLGVGAAVGIGSAAIVAALLFTRRKSDGKK